MLGFKLFFLEAEDMHPFEQWHNEYKNAFAKERQSRQSDPRRISSTSPYKTKNMHEDPRAKNLLVVEVISIDGFSSGHRSFGDTPEKSAGNPFINADWTFDLDPKFEKELIGKTGFILDESGGSFHERWGRLKAFVIVNDIVDKDNYEDLPDGEKLPYTSLHPNQYLKIEKFFKFEGMVKTAELLKDMQGQLEYPKPSSYDSSHAYWTRLIAKNMPPREDDPTGYNPRDDYFKH